MNAATRTKGIILGQYEAKAGADALFLIYTEDAGKILVKARGIKKINSKLAGHMATFGLLELNIAGIKEVRQLIGAVLLRPVWSRSVEGESICGFLREFVMRAVPGEEKDRAFWDLLEKFLLNIDLNKKFEQLRLFCYLFALRALTHFGYFAVNMGEKYFNVELNKNVVQALLNAKGEFRISERELNALGAGLKHLMEDVFEKEMKAWV